MSGERQPIPIPIDENIISLARWAADEYNKQQHNLEFKGVRSAKWLTPAGATHYWIVLDAADGGEINNYEAYVIQLVTPEATKTLEDFKPLLQA